MTGIIKNQFCFTLIYPGNIIDPVNLSQHLPKSRIFSPMHIFLRDSQSFYHILIKSFRIVFCIFDLYLINIIFIPDNDSKCIFVFLIGQ